MAPIAANRSLPPDELRMWADKKRKSLALSRSYEALDRKYTKLAERIGGCAPQIQLVAERGEGMEGVDLRTLFAGTCKARLCPLCATLRARRQYARVVPRFENALAKTPGTRAGFATFTVPNVPLDKAKTAGAEITAGFRRLTQRKAFKRAVAGWMRALEVTFNAEKQQLHPHLHVVLLFREGYFAKSKDLYITQPEWLALWRHVMRNDEIGIVDIRPLRPRVKGLPLSSALGEATKYPMKPLQLFRRTADGYVVDPAVLKPIHDGLKGKRLFGFGGVLRGMNKLILDKDDAADPVDDWRLSDDEIEALAMPDADEPFFVDQFDWNGSDYARPLKA